MEKQTETKKIQEITVRAEYDGFHIHKDSENCSWMKSLHEGQLILQEFQGEDGDIFFTFYAYEGDEIEKRIAEAKRRIKQDFQNQVKHLQRRIEVLN